MVPRPPVGTWIGAGTDLARARVETGTAKSVAGRIRPQRSPRRVFGARPGGGGGEGVEQPPQWGGGVQPPAGGGVAQLRGGTAQPGDPAGRGGPGQDLDAGVFVVAQPGTRGD